MIASIKKESTFSSGASFMRNQVYDKQSYVASVQPGVDAAFIVALAVLADEFHHDSGDS